MSTQENVPVVFQSVPAAVLDIPKARSEIMKLLEENIVADFIFQGSKITADGDCSHEIKRHVLLGRKVMTNLNKEHIKK